MKTIVIHLDEHDDLISVRDKMVWSKAQRILLVWPEDGHPELGRKFDLVLLQRQAIALGAQLGLVTKDSQVSANARDLGVARFRSEKQAQRQRWKRTRVRRRFRRRSQNPDQVFRLRNALAGQMPAVIKLGWTRLAIFTAGVFSVLIMGFYLLPGAVVELQPMQKEQKVNLTLVVDPTLARPSLNGIIPARRISTTVEIQGQIPTTGRGSIPDVPAQGSIEITNLSNRSLVIPAGSVVSTLPPGNLRFITNREVSLPGGNGKTTIVAVRAIFAGSLGNIPAESILILEGSSGPDVTVRNPAPFAGGKDRSLPVIAKTDYEKLRRELIVTLKKNALDDLGALLEDGQTILDETLVLEQVIQESALPEIGDPGDVLVLNIQAEYSALIVSTHDLNQLAELALDASLPENQQPVAGTLTLTNLSEPKLQANGRMEWVVNAARMTSVLLSRESLLKAVLGKQPEVAVKNLTSLMDLESPPKVSLTPSWWFWMPSLSFRVDFKVR